MNGGAERIDSFSAFFVVDGWICLGREGVGVVHSRWSFCPGLTGKKGSGSFPSKQLVWTDGKERG